MNDRKAILENFISTECSACGGVKKRKMSHCTVCYYRLPPTMRAALYQKFGSGYEEAFEAALSWLLERFPRPVPPAI